MRRLIILGPLALAGCTVNLHVPPGAQMAAVANPHCALVCTVRLSSLEYSVTAEGGQQLEASPTISISQGGAHVGAGSGADEHYSAPAPMSATVPPSTPPD